MAMPTYPAVVTEYKVTVDRNQARVRLWGDTGIIGDITFGEADSRDFINRGGWLNMGRPLVMLSAILDLLRNEKPVTLDGEGKLDTKQELAGEGE